MISPQHRRAVEEAIKKAIPAGVKAPDEFWRDLDAILDVFTAMETNRTTRPPWRDLEKWKRVEERAAGLIAELQGVRSPWLDSALRVLDDIKYRAGRAVIGYEMLATGYGGRGKPHRALLYDVICDLWLVHLKQQELPYSMSEKGKPCGPTIRFFKACLTPVLGGEFSPYVVRAAIERAKRARKRAKRVRIGGMFFETEV